MGILDIVTIVLIVLKALNIVELSWLQVFLPLIIEVCLALLVEILKH